jgi:alpha-L-rhamnosidase
MLHFEKRWEWAAIDWTSDWIWRSQRVRINDVAYFRKEVEVAEGLVCAQMYVSGHHYVNVYLNGAKVGGYGSPAPTVPWKRKLFNVYEVKDQLGEGTNCITADANYLGGGGQNYVDGLPGFRLELHLAYFNGQKKIVKTNTSWQTLVDMPHKTGTPYQQNRRLSAIEDFDARKWDEAWRCPGWNDAGRCRLKPKRRKSLAMSGRWCSRRFPKG